MRKPKLVATDVDGTLLDTNDEVPAEVQRVLTALIDDGTEFVLASGRPPRWLPQVVRQLGFSPLAVCANGAVTMNTASGEILHSELLDPATLTRIDSILRRNLPGSGIAAERMGLEPDAADTAFVASPAYEHAWLMPEHLQIGHEEVIAEPAIKLLARCPGESSSDMVAAIADDIDGLADVTFSTTNGLIEFAVEGVTKASALRRIADSHGIGASEVIAFGDMPNDIAMLQWAGHGVAMGNAMAAVIAAADEVTVTSDEAGLAHILRRWWP